MTDNYQYFKCNTKVTKYLTIILYFLANEVLEPI